jgi:hypothetical protein
VCGIVAVAQTPIAALTIAVYRWVRRVNRALERIEARSKRVRRTDPPLP